MGFNLALAYASENFGFSTCPAALARIISSVCGPQFFNDPTASDVYAFFVTNPAVVIVFAVALLALWLLSNVLALPNGLILYFSLLLAVLAGIVMTVVKARRASSDEYMKLLPAFIEVGTRSHGGFH